MIDDVLYFHSNQQLNIFDYYFFPQSRSHKGLVKVTNDTHFNLNPMLLSNISKSPYFLKCCNNLKDWNSLVDEIYYEVKSLEPWSNGTFNVIICLVYCILHSYSI